MIRRTIGAVLLAGGCATAGAGSRYTCDNTTSSALALRDYVRQLVTAAAADTLLSTTRERYRLPSGSASMVEFESSAARCAAAGRAYHGLRSSRPPAERHRFAVVKVGEDRFVVLDPEDAVPESEFLTVVIFDAAWRHLAGFTW